MTLREMRARDIYVEREREMNMIDREEYTNSKYNNEIAKIIRVVIISMTKGIIIFIVVIVISNS